MTQGCAVEGRATSTSWYNGSALGENPPYRAWRSSERFQLSGKSGMRLPGQDGATRKTPSRLLGSNPAPLQKRLTRCLRKGCSLVPTCPDFYLLWIRPPGPVQDDEAAETLAGLSLFPAPEDLLHQRRHGAGGRDRGEGCRQHVKSPRRLRSRQTRRWR
jgi:hypothetical protein